MRHDRLLRAVAIGLSLAALPVAHAARPTAGPPKPAVAASSRPSAKLQKIARARKADVVAARSALQMKIELGELLRQPRGADLSLLTQHHEALNRHLSLTPLVEQGERVLGLQYGSLYVQEGGAYPRRAEASDLEKAGIFGQQDFDRVVSARVAKLAQGVKGVDGKDAQEILLKDIARTREIMSEVSYGRAIGHIRNYRANVLAAAGRIKQDEPVVLAEGAKGQLVVVADGVRWKEGEQIRDLRRADLESVGVTTVDDLKRLSASRLFQLVHMRGDPDSGEALAKAEAIYQRERAEVAGLEKMLFNPHGHADLALVARARLSLQGNKARPIVLASAAGERLEFAPNVDKYYGAPIHLVKDAGGAQKATVADLRRFGIDSMKAFEAAASHVLTAEGK